MKDQQIICFFLPVEQQQLYNVQSSAPYFSLAPAVDATGTSLTIHVFLVIETLSLCNSAVLDDSNSTILQYTVHIKTSKIKVLNM